ncbi:uncharacterized protein YraI [Mesorhizobium sp. J18]|uniref:SH3 domain-containing protein n=1 Tax=Mesorhizobium sp. J18 TaxID=935263 RepID=UPI00119C2A23|nr:SH3 domain-containing protein [Mesorhizobium sp. J18]TWG95537.1 uncharacterized protein YraI [Mesorhizobium sp. J18]
MLNNKLRVAALAAGLMAPAIASAAERAITTTDLNMRLGPSTGYERIDTIPGGDTVLVHGCLSGYGWCDIEWDGLRGWVSGDYLAYLGERYYRRPVSSVGVAIGLPIVTYDYNVYRHRHYHGHRSDFRRWIRHERREARREWRQERRENRAEQRRERRQEARQERRQERREEARRERREERRDAIREQRRENRAEQRRERRQEVRQERRQERRADRRVDRREERRERRQERRQGRYVPWTSQDRVNQ